MPIPYTSRSTAFNSQLRGADIEVELDRLYVDANSLLTQIENVLGLNSNVTSEVLAARKGQPNLLAEIDRLEAIKAEVEAARNSANQGGAFASLDARLEAIDTRITNALSAVQGAAEVVEARVDSAGKVHAAIRQAINNGSKDLEGLSLAAINRVAMVSTSIIDAIIYDTSRDSDGSAWRERCQHLSWFNEARPTGRWLGVQAGEGSARAAGGVSGDYYWRSAEPAGAYRLDGSSGNTQIYRGSSAKFPAIALIVATTTSVIIFDATDPSLPMWMVFIMGNTYLGASSGTVSSVAMVNGVMVVGESVRMVVTDFIGDRNANYNSFGRYSFSAPIALRNNSAYTFFDSTKPIVNSAVNDVAATIIPGAPIDPATGLPCVTIAAATAGGVSVIKQDGTVVNITGQASPVNLVTFNDQGEILCQGEYQDSLVVYSIPATSVSWNTWKQRYIAAAWAASPNIGLGNLSSLAAMRASTVALGVAGRLSILHRNPASAGNGMVSYTTKDYFSGILLGDIRRAWLASGTAETITGANLVTNGTFNTGIEGWSSFSSGSSNISWDPSGKLALNVVDSWARAVQVVPGLVTGKSYQLEIEVASGSGVSIEAKVQGAGTWNQIPTTGLSVGKNIIRFISAGVNVELYIISSGSPGVKLIDNVSVRLVDEDRSVKNKGINVYGSLTKSSVAPGAELMGYSGFSAANYLEDPYSADLDFGTGDFYVYGWLKPNSLGSWPALLQRRKADNTGKYLWIGVDGAASKPFLQVHNGTTPATLTSDRTISNGAPVFIFAYRESGILKVAIDGVVQATTLANTYDLSIADAVTRLGVTVTGANPLDGTLALWRIGAGAPSPEQIRMIYEAERHLFTDNAKCLLGGSSNAIQKLDYDPETERLLVGTGNGVSVFQGLRRVDYLASSPLTNTNMKAVSGRNGAILMAGGAEAVFQAPQHNIREEVERVKRRFVARQPQTAWHVAVASQVEFDLPSRDARVVAVSVNTASAINAPGSFAYRYQIVDYGYKKAIRFGAAPDAGAYVGITYVEEV